MTIFKINSIKNLGYIIISIALLSINSCQGQGNRSQKKNENESIKKTTVKAPNIDIHTATFYGNLDAVKQHINAGSDLNPKDEYGSTSLNIAATFGKTDIALALINGGADIHTTNAEGSTPLHVASFFCRTEIVKALLEKGADKSLTNNYGSTPLMSVSGAFSEVEPFYQQISKNLGQFGLKLDFDYLEKTRPVIAELLK